jgi:hypothetical protein
MTACVHNFSSTSFDALKQEEKKKNPYLKKFIHLASFHSCVHYACMIPLNVDFRVTYAIKERKGNANCKQRKSFRVKNVLKSHLQRKKIFSECVGGGKRFVLSFFISFRWKLTRKCLEKRKIEKRACRKS